MSSSFFATRAIKAGEEPDFREGAFGDVVAPLHLSTTFARNDVNVYTGGMEYTRSQNPTRKAFEEKIAALENGKFGLAFSSGLAAETNVLLALLAPEDNIVAFDDLYGGTKRLFNSVLKKIGITTTYADATNPKNVEKAVKNNTKLIWLETPTNPLLKVCNIAAIAKIAEKNGLILVVDNTFLSPYFQKPLDLGAHISLHSTTKYIGGHSDTLGGAVVMNSAELYEKIKFYQNSIGAVLSPFDSYLNMRGLKTLALRMERHQQNAFAVAKFLEKHPKVKRVFYTGLSSHPQHKLAEKQQSGFGGVISFELRGTQNGAEKFLSRLKIFSIAESLGGVESLAELPCVMTHASISREERLAIGISDTLIRISVGVEDAEDLVNDLRRALG